MRGWEMDRGLFGGLNHSGAWVRRGRVVMYVILPQLYLPVALFLLCLITSCSFSFQVTFVFLLKFCFLPLLVPLCVLFHIRYDLLDKGHVS